MKRKCCHKAYIGIGSNLGRRKLNIQNALSLLTRKNTVKLLKISSFYETKPVGGPKQPGFLNAAAIVRTELSPKQLLSLLKDIEKRLGRNFNSVRWGPRPIDLDILFYDKRVMRTKDLTVPHPQVTERLFVLRPLAQIAPRYKHPNFKKTVKKLLDELKLRF
ncbi:MAG: 2-amino-4-hydroxy-6-hydroxymethyldihydropteridine diphosphokinase [Candidatus Omnitrophica bacterium]|nr:2-amino-4-hydroxy-6-hydroxymethyldihydropteridine diphosphokinase [Candidatus Omnitrophota bacterium]